MPEFWEKHLTRGEKLLWTGRPEKGRRLAMTTLGLRLRAIQGVLIFVLPCAYVIFEVGFETMSKETRGVPAYFASWLALGFFGAISLPGFICPSRLRNWSWRVFGTRYALTNKRALVAKRNGKLVEILRLNKGLEPWREPDAVFFELLPKSRSRPRFRGVSGRLISELGGFEMISDSEKVYDLAIAAIAKLD